jgi:transposase
MRSVAAEFGVSVGKVAFWVRRADSRRLDRVDFTNRAPGCPIAWNRLDARQEQRILELRTGLRKHSVLGEYGAEAIQQALHSETSANAPSRATINRVLARHGLQDAPRRSRRPAPPRGWYLPAVAGGQSELDSFDLIEDLKIAGGPLTSILTGTSLHGGLVDAWPLSEATAKLILQRLIERWQREGLPQYAQFDNGTQFQGAHQWPDSIGRVSRLCLALQVIPVFAPPREPGFQNAIEGFNALWQTKVWQLRIPVKMTGDSGRT